MTFRKIDTRIWYDEKFLALSEDGQALFIHLLTHPDMTMLGAMKTTSVSLAADRRWQPRRLEKALGEVTRSGMASFNDVDRLLILPNFLRYNPPASPNVVRSWAAGFDKLPPCVAKNGVAALSQAFLKDFSEGFRKAFPEDMAKASAKASREAWPTTPKPYQEQEQEQEKYASQEGTVPLASGSTTVVGASAPALKVVG